MDDSGDEIGDEDGGDLIAIDEEAEKFRVCDNKWLIDRSGELYSLPVGVPRWHSTRRKALRRASFSAWASLNSSSVSASF